LNFECMTCLMNERVRTGTHIVRTVVAVFPYLCFGKKSNGWSNTERRPNVLLRRPDGILRRPDGCKGSDFSYLEYVQNLLEV